MKTLRKWRSEVFVERRSSQRHQLSVPVLFRWNQAGGGQLEGCGFTRDVSPSGTYVTCDDYPGVTTAIRLELLLPALELNTVGMKLRAEGCVVRLGADQESPGFAVRTALSVCE